MEHLGLDLLRKAVPEYHGNDYDGKYSFQEFPDKHNWKLDTSSGKIIPSRASVITSQGDLRKRYSRFMQSWLFFGLIAAVVFDDDVKKFEPELRRFITEKRSSVTTVYLQGILKNWKIREMNTENARGRNMRMIRAQLTLDLARKVVSANCSLKDPVGNIGDEDPMEMRPELALSLMIIGETLTNAKAQIIKQTGFHVRGWYGDTEEGWGTPEAVIGWMRKDHWCPRTVKLLRAQLRHNATALLGVYASHVGDVSFEGHGNCNEDDDCKAKSQNQSNSEKYATKHHPECKHVKGTGACKMRGVKIEDVIGIIAG